MKNYDNYLFRPHSVGNIMSGLPNPLTKIQEETLGKFTKRKNGEGRPLTENQLQEWGYLSYRKKRIPVLSDGAKRFCEKLVYEDLTGRSSKLKNQFTDKGLYVEEKSLSLYSNYKDALVIKNKQRKTNEYFSGECDIAFYKVRDIKSSWSFETFPLSSEKIPSPIYEWQLDAYMDLFKYKRSELIYCLVDTPKNLIEDELRRSDWKFHILNQEGNVIKEKIPLVVETITNLIYTNKGLEDFCKQNESINIDWFEGVFKEIPEEIRIKIYKHNYSDLRNWQLKEMIKLAREYMNEILYGIGTNALLLNDLKKAS